MKDCMNLINMRRKTWAVLSVLVLASCVSDGTNRLDPSASKVPEYKELQALIERTRQRATEIFGEERKMSARERRDMLMKRAHETEPQTAVPGTLKVPEERTEVQVEPEQAPAEAAETGEPSSAEEAMASEEPVEPDEEPREAAEEPASLAEQPAVPEAKAGSNAEEEKTLYSFEADGLPMKQALAMFAQSNDLNIVPDPGVSGEVTVNIHDLPLNKVMEALLDAYGYTWEYDEGLIRVYDEITEAYQVDYLRMVRSGFGSSFVSLSSGTMGQGQGGVGGSGGGGFGGGGFGGGGFGGGGFGGGGLGGQGQGGQGGMGGASGAGLSSMALQQENEIDFWEELQSQLESLLSPQGRLVINRTAGYIQVTDMPKHIGAVRQFLHGLKHTVHRQVEIEAEIYELTLNNQFQLGINWNQAFRDASDITGGFEGSTIVTSPFGGGDVEPPAFSFNLEDQDDTEVLLEALKRQGTLEVVSQPKLRTLHNQTAIIKVGTERPFFNRTDRTVSNENTFRDFSETEITMVTVGTILSLTPQIGEDNWISLDISPVITSLLDTEVSPDQLSTAPVLDIKQVSTLVRVEDGTTVVLGGLIKNSRAETIRKIPLLGDIPGVGELFKGRFNNDEKSELVIFLTPRIVGRAGALPPTASQPIGRSSGGQGWLRALPNRTP